MLEDKDSTGKIYSGPILVLGIVQFIESIAVSIPFAYFPAYAMSLGSSDAMIGLFFSSFMISQAVLSPKIGGLSDHLGRKKIILWGLLGDVILGTLTGLAPDWIWLLLIRVVNGGVSAAAMVPAEALLIDLVSPKKRGEASGFVRAMGNMGRSVGPLFGGLIQWTVYSLGFGALNSYRVPYFADSILAFLALILVAWKIREPESIAKTAKPANVSVTSVQPVKTEISMAIRVMLVTFFVTGMGVGFILPVSVLFYVDKFGIYPVEIGFILAITGFVGVLTGWFGGRLSDKIGRKPVIGLGGIPANLLGIVLPLTFDINQATIVMALRSVGFRVLMPAMAALRADIVPAKSRGRIFGLFNTAATAGFIVGPILGTWLYSLYRFETLNIVGLVLPGYGLPFFIKAIIGSISVMNVLLFVKYKQTTK